jgi:hypothetical protein
MPIIWDEGGGPQLTLRQKIIATINSGAMAIVNGISEPIKTGLHNLHDWILVELEADVKKMLGPTLVKVRDMEGMPDMVKETIDLYLASHSPQGVPSTSNVVALVCGALIGNIILGPLRLLNMQIMKKLRPGRPSYRDIIEGAHRLGTVKEYVKDWLDEMGFPDDIQDFLWGSMWSKLSIPIVAELQHRGEISPEEARTYIMEQGYGYNTASLIQKTFELLPTMSDLIRFAIRDVFAPEIARAFGQFDEFPTAEDPQYGSFLGWAKKIGLPEDVAMMFWASKWTLPSPAQGFAMYHRMVREPTAFSGVAVGSDEKGPYYRAIDWEHLNLLLRALDIMPAWRAKLLETQYTLPTRIDIRRALLNGLVTEENAIRMYRMRGYDEESVELQLKLARGIGTAGNKELTKADIINAYTKLGWDRAEAVEMLAELGYDPGEIDYYLDYADYQRAKEYTDTAEKLIKTQYVRGIIDQTTANGRLAEMGETAAQISVLMQLWTLEKEATTEHPSVSQLTDFYSRRIIAGPRLEAELSHLNYTSEYISWIHSAIDSRIAEENAKKSAAELRSEMTRHHYPTLSDLDSWLEVGIIDYATYRQRILDLGYSPVDADRFVEEQRRKLAGQPAFPSRADLGRWFLTNIISRGQYIGRMLELGYTRADIDLYLAEMYARMSEEKKAEEQRLLKEEMARVRTPSRADLGRWLLVGLITQEEYSSRMEGLGYSSEDIQRYLVELTGKW